MFLILAIRVYRELYIIHSLYTTLLWEDQEHRYLITPISGEIPREWESSKGWAHLGIVLYKQRVTGSANPPALSVSLGSKYSNKASYVGTRIVVNKVNFVIVLRKDTDWRLDTLQSISFPKRMAKLYFISCYTHSYISGICIYIQPCSLSEIGLCI